MKRVILALFVSIIIVGVLILITALLSHKTSESFNVIQNNKLLDGTIMEYKYPPDDSQDTEEDFTVYNRGRFNRPGWRRWPNRYWGRPWVTNRWLRYPQYVYTYPLTNYTTEWVEPIERFTIRIGKKTAEHPFYEEGSKYGYLITSGTPTNGACGTSGAQLRLKYGSTYEFDIYTEKDCITGEEVSEPFYFTTNSIGGSTVGSLFNINPTINGTIRIHIANNLPRQFYYQSTQSKKVGGYVICVN
jgi:hypothetical protein